MTTKNLIFLSLIIGFILLGISAESKPQVKSERIYNSIKPYMPYKLEKTLTGYAIISTQTKEKEKEKPPASQLWKRLDQLEQIWGEQHLKIENNELIILDDYNQTIKTIPIETPAEKQWLISFFNLTL